MINYMLQNNKNKKRKSPVEERKPDVTANIGSLDEIIAKQRDREKKLYPVRISKTTVIYVTKKKATPEYAEEYKRDKLMRLNNG